MLPNTLILRKNLHANYTVGSNARLFHRNTFIVKSRRNGTDPNMQMSVQSKENFVSGPRVEWDLEDPMDDMIFEQVSDTIFVLIPEVPRLKQLFLSWIQLGTEDRTRLDEKVASWSSPNRRQLYKSLEEALVRWETVQNTEGAPGCEPGMVSFSSNPQLEEELVGVICSMETLFTKGRRNPENEVDFEISGSDINETSLNLTNSESNLRPIVKDRTPHSVHSCGYIVEFKNSDDELNGYLTN